MSELEIGPHGGQLELVPQTLKSPGPAHGSEAGALRPSDSDLPVVSSRLSLNTVT
jgi:hypothetical protein